MPAVSLALDDLPTREFGAQVLLPPAEYRRISPEAKRDAEQIAVSQLTRIGCAITYEPGWLLRHPYTADNGAHVPAVWHFDVGGERPHTDHPPKDAVTLEFERLGFYLWETPY